MTIKNRGGIFGRNPTFNDVTIEGSFNVGTPNFTGDVTVTSGDLIIGTSGNGIDFSATAGTGTSELFSDYEQGTFTPSFTTSNADLTSGYASQSGTYTKIGNVVNCHGTLVLSSVSGGTGTLLITGLPYTVSLLRGGSTGFAYNWATHYPEGYLNSGVNIAPYFGSTATGYSSMTSANLNTNTQLYFFVSYITS